MKKTKFSSLTEPSFQLVAETVQTHLASRANLISIVPLTGDASNRRYFRLEIAGGPVSSLILMQLADPEGFKESEEAVSGSNPIVTELPFVNILNHLAQSGVMVPFLHYYDESAGLLYLEDFGDLTLFHVCANNLHSDVATLYSRAIDTLVQLHLCSSSSRPQDCIAFNRSFDRPLFMWEFNHFLEYGVVARGNMVMCPDDQKGILQEFQKIADFLAAQPQVFTHRDYHSRNLMVVGDRLGVIDFQDALMGPVTYDLASLLRDSYVKLDEMVVETLIDRYIEGMQRELNHTAQEILLLTDRAAFRRLFDLTSIQRNLKAAGRFVYIDRVKHNPKFLEDIPRTLAHVRRNLERYPELTTLRHYLSPYVPEFQ